MQKQINLYKIKNIPIQKPTILLTPQLPVSLLKSEKLKNVKEIIFNQLQRYKNTVAKKDNCKEKIQKYEYQLTEMKKLLDSNKQKGLKIIQQCTNQISQKQNIILMCFLEIQRLRKIKDIIQQESIEKQKLIRIEIDQRKKEFEQFKSNLVKQCKEQIKTTKANYESLLKQIQTKYNQKINLFYKDENNKKALFDELKETIDILKKQNELLKHQISEKSKQTYNYEQQILQLNKKQKQQNIQLNNQIRKLKNQINDYKIKLSVADKKYVKIANDFGQYKRQNPAMKYFDKEFDQQEVEYQQQKTKKKQKPFAPKYADIISKFIPDKDSQKNYEYQEKLNELKDRYEQQIKYKEQEIQMLQRYIQKNKQQFGKEIQQLNKKIQKYKELLEQHENSSIHESQQKLQEYELNYNQLKIQYQMLMEQNKQLKQSKKIGTSTQQIKNLQSKVSKISDNLIDKFESYRESDEYRQKQEISLKCVGEETRKNLEEEDLRRLVQQKQKIIRDKLKSIKQLSYQIQELKEQILQKNKRITELEYLLNRYQNQQEDDNQPTSFKIPNSKPIQKEFMLKKNMKQSQSKSKKSDQGDDII